MDTLNVLPRNNRQQYLNEKLLFYNQQIWKSTSKYHDNGDGITEQGWLDRKHDFMETNHLAESITKTTDNSSEKI